MYKIDEIINKILQGDVLKQLKLIPDNSINVCVTSPPYYGLRDYQTGYWEGGDNKKCDHLKVNDERKNVKVCKKCGAIRIDE